jgi:hypothetical protein
MRDEVMMKDQQIKRIREKALVKMMCASKNSNNMLRINYVRLRKHSYPRIRSLRMTETCACITRLSVAR